MCCWISGACAELGRSAQRTQHESGMDRRRCRAHGIIIGHGTIDGRMVCVLPRRHGVGGSVASSRAQPDDRDHRLGHWRGSPSSTFMDSYSARIQEALGEVCGPPNIFYQNVCAGGGAARSRRCSATWPGWSAYSAALTDDLHGGSDVARTHHRIPRSSAPSPARTSAWRIWPGRASTVRRRALPTTWPPTRTALPRCAD